MGLPEINISFLDELVSLPVHMHPPIIHFVVALPVIILLIELFNLVFRRKILDVLNFGLLALLLIFMIGAYISGVTDGKEAWDLLDENGQEALKAHKTFGIYIILFGFVAVAIFKVVSLLSRSMIFNVLYMLILALFVVLILKQAKDGGELVIVHGANIQKVKALDDKLFDLESAYEDLNASYNEIRGEDINATKKKPHKDINSTIVPVPLAKKS
ncbi:MAG: hypothetical protein PHV08_07965 [Sulfurovaceae bacterium]|nr:hypothetical protein [Sulfurovaceae bacterium]